MVSSNLRTGKIINHLTCHMMEPVLENNLRIIIAYCNTCDWKERVDVTNLTWAEGIRKVLDARDEHERRASWHSFKEQIII